MEVASPLGLHPVSTGKKRSLACSPPLMDAANCGNVSGMEHDDGLYKSKRRRFHADTSIDSLSESFSSHSPFFSQNIHANKGIGSTPGAVKRTRTSSPVQNDLNRIVEEQAALIESLKSEKSELKSNIACLKSENVRISKENQILRKALTYQQERKNQVENDLKEAQKFRVEAEEQMKKFEQLILSLRYHLQAQQSNIGNDFMGMPPSPPDVF